MRALRFAQVTIVERDTHGWRERDVRGGELITLVEPQLKLSVDELYEGIALES